jgi:3-methyladenine DNA glycosylase/8-oxoguanine DNA glycosylase
LLFEIETPDDFSFHETVSSHGWLRLLPFTWHDHAPADWTDWRPPSPLPGGSTGVLERIEELPSGRVVLLRIAESKNGLTVDIGGDVGGGDEGEIARRVRRMLQLDLDIADFLSFTSAHPKLGHIRERRQGRILRSPTLFEDVVKVICTTNTTWSQTKGMVARIVNEFGGPMPSSQDGRRPFPTPQAIASTTLDDFAARARLGYRNGAVHGLATDIVDGRIDIEAWQDQSLPAAELENKLLGLRGIGPYGAACLMLYLGKPWKVNVDSWARMMVGKELGRKVEDKEVHAFFADYGEWRGLVYHFYPWEHES